MITTLAILGVYILVGTAYLLWIRKLFIYALRGDVYGGETRRVSMFILTMSILSALIWPLLLLKSTKEDLKRSEGLYITKHVSAMFRRAAEEKGEELDGGSLMIIAMKFHRVHQQFGWKMFEEHLKYELEKYREEGLREDYVA